MKDQKNIIYSGFIWRFMERMGAQGVSLVVSVILARLLIPEDYGVVSLVTIFISIANIFVVDGLPSALVQKKDVNNEDYSTVFYANMIFSLVVYAIIFIMAPGVSVFYDNTQLTTVLRVMALKIPIAALNSVQQAYVSKNLLFKRFFFSTLIGTVVSAIVGIWMAFKGFGVWALVTQYLVNSIMDTSVLWFTVKWRPILKFSKKRLRIFTKFGWKVLVSSLINVIYDNARSLIIGKMYTTSDLAYFTKGQQYPSLIITNFDSTINSVLFPALSLYQDNVNEMMRMARKSIRMSTYVTFPMMAGLALVSDSFVKLTLTEKWLPIVPYMVVSCIYLAIVPLGTANAQAMKAIGRSDVFLKLQVIKKVIGVALLMAVMNHGVLAIAISLIIYYVIAVCIDSVANKKYLDYGLGDMLKDIRPALLLTVIMIVTVFVTKKSVSILHIHYVIGMFIEIVMGILVYLLASYVTKNKEMMFLIEKLVSTRK